ncbi:MAG: nitroreductase family protein [Rhodobacter sp.]|jgi:nitroreductase|nr:nitroreductase family protein [Rhodobacter sp.]
MNQALPPARRPGHAADPMFPARWSPRAFADRTVSAEDIMVLLEAARFAPSASNHQPWRFVWSLRGDPGFAAIRDALVPFNADWAGKAAALIVVATKSTVTGKDGAEAPNHYAAFDAGAAWMSLALQAQVSGLVAHAMAGFDHAALALAVALPEGHALHAVVAVGHLGKVETLPEGLRARETPSPRRLLADLAVRGRF